VFDHNCGHELDPAVVCRHCGTEVNSDDLRLRVVTPGWTRAGAVHPDNAVHPDI
jgi:hypothetical protein